MKHTRGVGLVQKIISLGATGEQIEGIVESIGLMDSKEPQRTISYAWPDEMIPAELADEFTISSNFIIYRALEYAPKRELEQFIGKPFRYERIDRGLIVSLAFPFMYNISEKIILDYGGENATYKKEIMRESELYPQYS